MVPVLARAEQTLAKRLDREIIEDAHEIGKRFKRMAKNLSEMNNRRLYYAFGFFSFEEYCQKRLGKSRQYIYKIIQAHDFVKLMESQGVSEDETDALSERLIREIRGLPQYKQVLVTKAVARIKRQTGRVATVVDVKAEAEKLDGDGEQGRIYKEQAELLKKFEGVAKTLRVGLAFDTMTDDFRRRLTVSLMSIAESVKLLLAALNSPIVEARIKAVNTPEPEPAREHPHSEISAEDKARIIKEEIAEHHGETGAGKKRRKGA
jgi:hypothetical protein